VCDASILLKGQPLHILIVTASFPHPPASGGELRVHGIVKGLAQAGHQVTMIAYADKNIPNGTPLHDYCESIIIVPSPTRTKTDRLRNLIQGYADIARRLYSTQFRDELFKLIDAHNFDLIQFEAIEIACFMPEVRIKYPNVKICFDTFNAEADLQRAIFNVDRRNLKRAPIAIYSWIQSRRIYQYEGDLCRMSDMVIAVSQEDSVLLQEYRNDKQVVVLPSGINVDSYQSIDSDLQLPQPNMVFTGKMDYRPNVDAMLWFYEHIYDSVNDAKLIIVGQKPHARLQPLLENPDIELTGWVDSVLPYLQQSTVYIAPLRMGSGTRLKILEALASGCAIVATSLAAAGLNDELKATMMIADSPDDFAQAIQSLMQSPEKRETLKSQGANVVRKYYDWQVLIPQLLSAYEENHIG